jgi:hypothetical protein
VSSPLKFTVAPDSQLPDIVRLPALVNGLEAGFEIVGADGADVSRIQVCAVVAESTEDEFVCFTFTL